MTNISILLIDDEESQVLNLQKSITQRYESGVSVLVAHEEKDILSKVENCYYDIAIVDLRMSDYSINGFDIIEKIKNVSPFSKVIIVSAYAGEYQSELNKALNLGNILGFVDKTTYKTFIENILELINGDITVLGNTTNTSVRALKDYYADLKNMSDAYAKGKSFENFIAMLFGQMGFTKVMNRIVDRSSNEIDLAIRNDIDDPFFSKFKQYIFVECKNYPENGVDRNVFTVFKEKVKNSNGLSDLGILVTTGYIKKPAYLEAMRSSGELFKIIFLSNPEIERLIYSENKLDTLKLIIDDQVKDN